MRKVQVTAQGPLGWSDSTETFSEEDLVLTASGEVKHVRRLREGDILIRFLESNVVQRWTILKIEWVRRVQHHAAVC